MNPSSQIQRLLDERALETLTPDAAAIGGLWIKAIHSDLDAREASLSTDNRVGLAYQSGLQAVHALLQAHGYRVRSKTKDFTPDVFAYCRRGGDWSGFVASGRAGCLLSFGNPRIKSIA